MKSRSIRRIVYMVLIIRLTCLILSITICQEQYFQNWLNSSYEPYKQFGILFFAYILATVSSIFSVHLKNWKCRILSFKKYDIDASYLFVDISIFFQEFDDVFALQLGVIMFIDFAHYYVNVVILF